MAGTAGGGFDSGPEGAAQGMDNNVPIKSNPRPPAAGMARTTGSKPTEIGTDMTAAQIVARKGSHVRLVDGTFVARSYSGLTGVWGKLAHKDDATRRRIPTRPAHRVADAD